MRQVSMGGKVPILESIPLALFVDILGASNQWVLTLTMYLDVG